MTNEAAWMRDAIDRARGPLRRLADARRWVGRFAVFLLLVGLWVMHGMSGMTDAGCHGAAMPLPMGSMAATTPMNAAPTVMPGGEHPEAAPAAPAIRAQMLHGDLCVSGQPPTFGLDLLALLALLALGVREARKSSCGRVCLRFTRRTRRRAPPGLSGIRLLTAVCVSRT